MQYYVITPKNHGWGWGYGFFSNYRICLAELMYYHQHRENIFKNKKPYISWGETTWVDGFDPMKSKICESKENPFDWWFEQDIPSNKDRLFMCRNKNGSLIDHAEHYFFKKENLEYQKRVEELYIKPKKFILDKIEELYEKEFKNEIVLGVVARGSEYNTHHGKLYGMFDANKYIKCIEDVLEKNKDITKIFVVSEEIDYIKKIEEKFENVYYMPNIFRRTDESEEYLNKNHHWMNISDKRENHTRLLGEECITQIKLLGKCDYISGRFCGLTAGGILWNEQTKNVFIFK